MKLHELKSSAGARKKRKRVGRGNSSGSGTYCGRGMNGQSCRSGKNIRIGFEGGQTPLLRRIPKLKGFTNPSRREFLPLNLSKIEKIFDADQTVSPESLLSKKVISKNKMLIKILASGEINKKLSFENLSFSKSAKEKIKKAGGEIKNEISFIKNSKKNSKN